MVPKLKRYQSDFEYSYCLGVYPTLELITYQPQAVLAVLLHSKGSKNQGVEKIRRLAGNLQIEIQENDHQVEKLSQRGNTYAIGVFQKYAMRTNPQENHLVLVNPSSMGNLGTIMRTMLGFGYQDLAIIDPAADAFHPKVIRASMGAFFQVRLQNFRSFTDYWGSQANHKLYPLMTDGKIPLPEAILEKPYALVFGDEGSGLGQEYHQYGTSLRIPQAKEVDSLNLALAVGITLYQGWIQDQRE
ncbi:MAG: TrmH family RNA methyltransferase [Chloroflexota bacterium]|nr:MAG: TrmH family RNA methyltransferase [Chloroflexota bacterium]HDD56313.1 TrmH family RNA methyltransferase [Chloroflexota bacterium]